MNSDSETPEMPIAEDWFWSNSECVCDKTPDNDYPCWCDMIDSSSDLNNPFGNGDRHCRECRVAKDSVMGLLGLKKKEGWTENADGQLTKTIKLPKEVIIKRFGIEVDRRGANKEGDDWYEIKNRFN